jgi:hypothetical protein
MDTVKIHSTDGNDGFVVGVGVGLSSFDVAVRRKVTERENPVFIGKISLKHEEKCNAQLP